MREWCNRHQLELLLNWERAQRFEPLERIPGADYDDNILSTRYLGNFEIELTFSDGKVGLLDGRLLLQRNGSLLEPLHDESYFRRHFIEAGALNWPNGLELSPAKLHQTCPEVMAA